MPRLERIRVHPVKALDPVERDAVAISPVGGLAGDRVYAIVDADGGYVNGKRTDAVHRLTASVDPAAGTIAIGERGGPTATFSLADERAALESWLGDVFGYRVHLETGEGGALTDSRVLGGNDPGVTVVSTATLEAVADWFPALDVEGVRDRFRANLEVGGVPAFWEDRLAADGGRPFRIGQVRFQGGKPVPRCVVPTRDPTTGEPTEGFRERFIERRRATYPEWFDPATDGGDYLLTVLTHPAEGDRGAEIAVGDPVSLAG